MLGPRASEPAGHPCCETEARSGDLWLRNCHLEGEVLSCERDIGLLAVVDSALPISFCAAKAVTWLGFG